MWTFTYNGGKITSKSQNLKINIYQKFTQSLFKTGSGYITQARLWLPGSSKWAYWLSLSSTWDNCTPLYWLRYAFFNSFLIFIIICVCVRVSVCRYPWKAEEGTGFPEAGSCRQKWVAVWMLGTKLRSFRRAKRALNLRVIFLGPIFNDFLTTTILHCCLWRKQKAHSIFPPARLIKMCYYCSATLDPNSVRLLVPILPSFLPHPP